MLHKLVPQPRAQVRPHLPGEAGEPGALTSALQRCTARRRSRRESVGEVVAMLEDVLEGARRAGGGVGGRRASRASQMCMGTPGGGVAHRGRLLEGDADAAARGVFDGLFGLLVQGVALQAVTERSQGAEMGTGARATHPSDRRT